MMEASGLAKRSVQVHGRNVVDQEARVSTLVGLPITRSQN